MDITACRRYTIFNISTANIATGCINTTPHAARNIDIATACVHIFHISIYRYSIAAVHLKINHVPLDSDIDFSFSGLLPILDRFPIDQHFSVFYGDITFNIVNSAINYNF